MRLARDKIADRKSSMVNSVDTVNPTAILAFMSSYALEEATRFTWPATLGDPCYRRVIPLGLAATATHGLISETFKVNFLRVQTISNIFQHPFLEITLL